MALGIREPELIALLWTDIDFERCLPHIRHKTYRRMGEIHRCTPKSGESHRTLSPPPELIMLLHEQRPQNLQEQIRATR